LKFEIRKGKHSIVLLYKGIAIKLFEEKFLKNYYKEKEILLKLRNTLFVPRIIRYSDKHRIIAMENVGDKNIAKLKGLAFAYTILLSLWICFIIDLLEIKKQELNHPEKHIYLKGLRVIFIDWERSTRGRNNLTQFLQYLRRFGVKLSLTLQRKYKKSRLFFFPIFLKVFAQLPKIILASKLKHPNS